MSGCERTGRGRIESAVPDVAAFWAAMRGAWESSNAAEVPPAPFNRSLRDKRGLVFGTIFLSPFLDSLLGRYCDRDRRSHSAVLVEPASPWYSQANPLVGKGSRALMIRYPCHSFETWQISKEGEGSQWSAQRNYDA